MMKKLLLVLLLPALIPLAQAKELPNRVTIEYTLSKAKTPIATATEVVSKQGKSYSITSEARAAGILALVNKGNIRRKSNGQIGARSLRPSEFQDQRGDDTPVVAKFDWQNHKLQLIKGDNAETVDLPEGTQDRLSFPYGFAFRPMRAKQFKFFMTDGKHLSSYTYVEVGRENLSTPMGKLKTLHLAKQREGDDDTGNEIWLAIDHYMLPVRVLFIEKDGSTLDQVATKISY